MEEPHLCVDLQSVHHTPYSPAFTSPYNSGHGRSSGVFYNILRKLKEHSGSLEGGLAREPSGYVKDCDSRPQGKGHCRVM